MLMLMIIGCSLFAADLEKLEQSYLSKAEDLQSDSDTKIKVIKDKLAKDSKRLAEAYLKSLKAMLKSETQKGDFDAAVKVKGKIVEIEAILKGEAVAPRPKPKSTRTINPLTGKWKQQGSSGKVLFR